MTNHDQRENIIKIIENNNAFVDIKTGLVSLQMGLIISIILLPNDEKAFILHILIFKIISFLIITLNSVVNINLIN